MFNDRYNYACIRLQVLYFAFITYSLCQDEDGSTRGAYPSVLNAAQGDPGVMWNYYEHDADLQYKATIKRGLFTTFQWDFGDGSIMTCNESMATIF